MATYTRTIDCSHNIRASLDHDGAFTLRARSRTAYADGAVVSAEVEVPADLAADVRDALDAALNAVHEQLAARVDQAGAVAATQARQMGEIQ